MILVKNVACHQEKKNSAAIDVSRRGGHDYRCFTFQFFFFFKLSHKT